MKRRDFLLAGCVLAAGAARAHHGWSAFDTGRPLWLRGRVEAVRWVNPHAEFDLQPEPKLALPADLGAREVPPQLAPVDARAILDRAQLPRSLDRSWRIELAPLSRMQAWGIERLREGETVEVVGYAFADEQPAVLRAEFLWRGGRAYGLRSAPARAPAGSADGEPGRRPPT